MRQQLTVDNSERPSDDTPTVTDEETYEIGIVLALLEFHFYQQLSQEVEATLHSN